MRASAALLAIVVTAGCQAGARAPGEAVMAPVASVEVPAAAPTPPAPPASSEPAEPAPPADSEEAEEPELPPHDDPNAPPPPTTPSWTDPCGRRCTGNDVCWVYEHRPPQKPSPPPPPDAGWIATFTFDEDAGPFRSEVHCLPQSTTQCPAGTSRTMSRMMMTNGVVTRWNTCTMFDGP